MGLHGYIDKQLTSDERVLYRAHLSWVPIVAKLLLFVLAAVGICVALNFANMQSVGFISAGVIVLIGVLFQLPAIIRNLSIDVVVTNKRIHSKKGLIMVQDDRESSLSRVDDTDIDFNNIFQRMFNYGAIEIRTLGNDLIKLDKVARPRELKRAINEAKEYFVDPSMTGVVNGAQGQYSQGQYPQGQYAGQQPLQYQQPPQPRQ